MPKITLNHVKFVASTAVGISASAVIKTLITQNTAPANRLHEAELYVGSFVLGSMIARAASAYTNQKIDEIVVLMDQIKDQMPNQKY